MFITADHNAVTVVKVAIVVANFYYDYIQTLTCPGGPWLL